MAGHSKWHNIKHRKAAQDAKKWKIYSIHSKLIALEAQKWWDPDNNPSLYAAIENAKKQWVPNDNIDRAIKKWTWEDKDWVQIVEMSYEWYWPWWIAIMVRVLTDNKNRTAANIRHIFTKYWWNLWESWAVSWMFKRKWILIIDSLKYSFEKIEELVYETNAEDIEKDWDIIKITTSVDDFKEVENFFIKNNIELDASEIDNIPDNYTKLEEFDNVLKFKKMLEAFDLDEDVESVSSNEEIDEKLSQDVDEFIEKNTFKT